MFLGFSLTPGETQPARVREEQRHSQPGSERGSRDTASQDQRGAETQPDRVREEQKHWEIIESIDTSKDD